MKKIMVNLNKSKCPKKFSSTQLQGYLLFKSRGSVVPVKKGKGSKYSRKEKHKSINYD